MAMRIRCLVVDDEPLARQIMARYIRALNGLDLIGECGNAPEAARFLSSHRIDAMFLDIKMPGMNGLEFLDTLANPPRVILTTAYSEYALAGYDYSVVDYLLKPISFERFAAAVRKLKSTITPPHAATGELDFIFLRADRVDHRVRFADIKYFEAYGNYVKVHRTHGTILAAVTMARLETLLPPDRFARVHKSYIVALDQVEQVCSHAMQVGGTRIPVGRSYRRGVQKALERNSRC